MRDYIVVGFSDVFVTKKGRKGRMISLGYIQSRYTGYKVIEVYCDEDAIEGNLVEGAVVHAFFNYNSSFCNGIKVV